MARGKAKAKVEDPVEEVGPPVAGNEVKISYAKRQIPASYVFELRGRGSNPEVVLQSGITTKSSECLLRGHSVKYPDLLEVGESTETVIDGLRFKLVRTA